MEAVSEYGLKSFHILPDLDMKRFSVQASFYSVRPDLTFRVAVMDGTKKVSQAEATVSNSVVCLLPVNKPKTWSPENPFLYDLILEVMISPDESWTRSRVMRG